MRRIAAVLAGVLILAVLPPGAVSGQRGRSPGFVYTSPQAIREAQAALAALEYLDAAACKAGEWDKATREAARSFQRDHFLRPDGLLDRDTMALLTTHAPARDDDSKR